MDELAALLAYYQDAFTTLPPEELAAFVQTMPPQTRAIGAAYAQGLLEGMAPPEGDGEGGAERVVGRAYGEKYVSDTSDALAEMFGGRWVEGPGGLVNVDPLALAGLAEDVTRGAAWDSPPDFTGLNSGAFAGGRGRGGNSRMWVPEGGVQGNARVGLDYERVRPGREFHEQKSWAAGALTFPEDPEEQTLNFENPRLSFYGGPWNLYASLDDIRRRVEWEQANGVPPPGGGQQFGQQLQGQATVSPAARLPLSAAQVAPEYTHPSYGWGYPPGSTQRLYNPGTPQYQEQWEPPGTGPSGVAQGGDSDLFRGWMQRLPAPENYGWNGVAPLPEWMRTQLDTNLNAYVQQMYSGLPRIIEGPGTYTIPSYPNARWD